MLQSLLYQQGKWLINMQIIPSDGRLKFGTKYTSFIQFWLS